MVDTLAEPAPGQGTVEKNQTSWRNSLDCQATASLPSLSRPRACGQLCSLPPSSEHLAVSLNGTCLAWGSWETLEGQPCAHPTVHRQVYDFSMGSWSLAAEGLFVRGSRVLFGGQEALLAQRSPDNIPGGD